jgi:dienelactone hydrolase
MRVTHLPVVLALVVAAPACGAAGRVEGRALVRRLERPDGPGPFPAVIVLHGCSGPHRKDADWAAWLRREGYVAVVTDSFRPRGVPADPFSAVVALYPPCFRLGRDVEIQSPLLILAGAEDDWAPAAWCQAFARTAAARGQPVSLTVYPGAHHGFDAAGLDTWKLGHHLRHDAAAHADAQARVRAFLTEQWNGR